MSEVLFTSCRPQIMPIEQLGNEFPVSLLEQLSAYQSLVLLRCGSMPLDLLQKNLSTRLTTNLGLSEQKEFANKQWKSD